MKICYINLYRGLVSQFYHLEQMLNYDKDICVLCCAETKIKDNFIPDFPGFIRYCLDPLKLVVYVRRTANLTVSPITKGIPAFAILGRQFSVLCLYSEFTKKVIGIGRDNKSRTVGPNERLHFIKETFLEYEKIQRKRTMCIGDMNFCAIASEEGCKDYKQVRELIKFFEQKGYENQVKVYTRLKVRETNDRNAALDHCWTKDFPGFLRVLPFSNSDHKMLQFTLPKNKTIRRRRCKVVYYRDNEESLAFLNENPLDRQSTYFEKKDNSLENNYNNMIDWCNEYRNLTRNEVYRTKLDVPWWNGTLTGLKKVMESARTERDYWYAKQKYCYYFDFFHRKWVGKNYKKLKHPFFKERPQPCDRLLIEGTEITDEKDICEKMLDQYIGKIERNKAESNPNWGEVINVVENWVATSDEHNIPLGENGVPVEWDIRVPNREEVRQLLREVAPKKSSGSTSVSLKTLKRVEGAILDTLTVIIQKSITTGNFAPKWHEIIGVPILKANKSADDVTGYRVICLENEIPKLISFWIAKVISEQVTQFKLLDQSTHGFVKGRGIDSFNQECLEEIMSAKMRNELCTLVGTDLSSAYDVCDANFCVAILKTLGAGPRLLNWLRTLYSEKSMIIRNGGAISDPRNYLFALLQGNSASCVNFNLCIFPIRLMVNCNIKKFADDLYLCIRSKNASDQLRNIRQEYKLFEDYVAKLGMKSAKSKLVACTWAKGDVPNELKRFEVDGEEVVDQDQIRVLGLILSKDLSFQSYVDMINSKVRQRAGMIRLKGKYMSTKARLQMYEGWVMGRLNVGIETYGNFLTCTQLKELDTSCNVAFRAALRLFRKSTQCISELRAKYKKPSFLQICRDRMEKAAFMNIEKFREIDKNIKHSMRGPKAGEVRRYNDMHKKSLYKFQRQAINSWELYKIKDKKELKFLQKLRLNEEFRRGLHFEPSTSALSRLELDVRECGVTGRGRRARKKSKQNFPLDEEIPAVERSRKLREFLETCEFKKRNSSRKKGTKMGKNDNVT